MNILRTDSLTESDILNQDDRFVAKVILSSFNDCNIYVPIVESVLFA